MRAKERFAIILRLLNAERTVTVQQLCDALHTSESTVRRDLLTLEQQGALVRLHGGATLPDAQFVAAEESMVAKEGQAVPEKSSIGSAAAQLVRADDTVYLDAGSSTLQMARALSGEALRATYVTNGIAHARILAQKGCRVYVPAGQIRPSTEAIVGASAMASLARYNFTKAFMGANGVALTQGFTTPDAEEAELKATALRRAREAWFLVDSTKFGKVYAAVICPLTEGALLTNRLPFDPYRDYTLIKENERL